MRGHPKYDLVQMKDAYDYLMTLDIDSTDNSLWDILHIAIWHKGIDRVDWILSNKELIGELIQFESGLLPSDLYKKVWDSMRYYKNLDR